MKRPEEVLWLPRSQVSFTVSSRHSIFSRLSWPPAREPLEDGSVLTAEHREQGLPRGRYSWELDTAPRWHSTVIVSKTEAFFE